jgi:hypothetical protein
LTADTEKNLFAQRILSILLRTASAAKEIDFPQKKRIVPILIIPPPQRRDGAILTTLREKK